MKNKKIIITIAMIVSLGSIGSIPACTNAYVNANDNKVQMINYREREAANEKGYKVNKYENVKVNRWLDENRVLVLKDNGVYSNPDSDTALSYISVYDINTKTYQDYKDVYMDSESLESVSPDGRYVLYGEPRIIPRVGGEEWQKAIDSGELFNKKRDILDLKTGEIINNFDKTLVNYEAQYKWINDDYIFVDYGESWKVLDRKGQTIKEGKLDYTGCNSNYSNLLDVSELKCDGKNISGKFYYTKDFMGADRNLGSGIYAMDINADQETLISKYEYSSRTQKQGDVIVQEYFNNNGGAEGGYFVNRTFGFRVMKKDGTVLRAYELPKGKNFDKLTLSTDGKKCAFLEEDNFDNADRSPLNMSIKVLDIETGEVTEAANMGKLIDKDKEEDLYNYKIGDKVVCRTPFNKITNISWDKTGNSLSYNYNYTAKADGNNYSNTFVVTFNK